MVLESEYTLGFIGCGNMGSAVLAAAIAGAEAAPEGEIVPKHFIVCVKTEESREALRDQFGDKVSVVNDPQAVIDDSHVVVLGFKPYMAREILSRLHYSHFTVIVSLLAGTTIDQLRQYTSVNAFIVRATTNTAARLGMGMTALSFQGQYHPDSPITLAVEWLFTQTGKYTVVEESKQDACVALCGSAPAFTYLFIEALADGAVRMGLPYDTATQMAAQVVKGAGHMVLDGNHPSVLRNQVCTPAGTTINGLAILEDRAVRGAVINALQTSQKVAQEFSRPASEKPQAQSLEASRQQSSINLAEMAQQMSLSRRSTISMNRQPTIPPGSNGN